MSRIRALPSPALVIALLALVAALTGAAVAKSGGGKSVTKKQAAKIADNQITARAAGLSVGHASDASNATNATDATNATNAGAVGGQKVIKVFAKLPFQTPSTTPIANLGEGFQLTGTCTGGFGAALTLVFSPGNAVDVQAQIDGDAGPEVISDQGVGPVSFQLSGSSHRGETAFSGATTSGTVISGTIGFDDPSTFNGESVCAFYGQVILG
jgi:hypothetical protein